MPGTDDLVHQTSTTTGTSDFVLATVSGKRAFSDISNATFYYFISHKTASEWEFGYTGLLSGNLDRGNATVLGSSNVVSGVAQLVSFSAGTKDVTSDVPATYQGSIYCQDASPSSPDHGDLWVKTDDAGPPLLVYLDDGDSSQWVQINALGGGDPSVWYDNVDANGYDLNNLGGFIKGASTGQVFNNDNAATTTPEAQILGTGFASANLGVARYANSSNSGYLMLGKSRGTSIGDYTIVQDGDSLGQIAFNGADGTDFAFGASIQAEVDGTPGAGDMPTSLVFYTAADGAESGTERLRIGPDGTVNATGGLYDGGYRVSEVLLSSGDISSGSATAVDIAIPSGSWRYLRLAITENANSASSTPTWYMQLGTGTGPTIKSGASDYRWEHILSKNNTTPADLRGSNNDSKIDPWWRPWTVAYGWFHNSFYNFYFLDARDSSKNTTIHGLVGNSYYFNTGNLIAERQNKEDNTYLRVYASAGVIYHLKWAWYGTH